jgi:hypothetical protein
MPKGCGCGEFRSSFHFLRRSKKAFLGLALPKESEWDEAKQKNRATTWSLDATAATILKSGTVKVYFPDKALAWSGVGRVGSCSQRTVDLECHRSSLRLIDGSPKQKITSKMAKRTPKTLEDPTSTSDFRALMA